jgi:acyl-CoA hydrolase
VSPDEIIAALPSGARVMVQGGAGESTALAQAVSRSPRLDLSFVGVWLPGVNTATYGAERGVRVTTFFMTPQLKAAGESVAFLPLGYGDIRAYLEAEPIDAMLAMVSAANAGGVCSFGVACDFLADLWPKIPIRVAHINSNMPHNHGREGIPRDALTHVFEQTAPLFVATPDRADAVSSAIAKRFADLVPNGATLQAGIGKLPGTCLRALSHKRDLRIHSGLIGDWVLDLRAAGALSPAPIIGGLALGSDQLYTASTSQQFEFWPVSRTHAPRELAKIEGLITLNSAMEVDLLGQAYSEAGADGFASGPGGALDFARGAKLAGGLRVIVLPSTARGDITRIVAPNAGRGPVTLSRFDTDIVITEHGAADLRGLSHEARAQRLIEIAAPAERATLGEAWRAYLSALKA